MQAWIGPAIIAALVSGIFAVLRERHFDGKRRRERVKDIQIALLAEIRAYVAVLRRDQLDEYEVIMVARMMADAEFVPFIPREKNDSVFQSILMDIHVLPESSIDPVVVYYSQVVAIAEMAVDMRTNVYRGLVTQRRIDIYINFIAMKKAAISLGSEAEAMLNCHLNGGDQAVVKFLKDRAETEQHESRQQTENWINSQVSDRSGL